MSDLSQYDGFIKEASDAYNIEPDIIRSVIMAESSGNPDAQSPTGPVGLMQLSKAAAKEGGITPDKRWNPRDNIMAGTKYLRQMYDQFGPVLGHAAYHDGPGAVQKALASNDLSMISPAAVEYTRKIRGGEIDDLLADQSRGGIPRFFSNGEVAAAEKKLAAEREAAQKEAEAQSEVNAPSFGQTWRANYEENSLWYGALDNLSSQLQGRDPSFEPNGEQAMKDLEAHGVSTENVTRLMEATSSAHYAKILDSMVREKQNLDTIARSGFMTNLGANLMMPDTAALAAITAGTGLGATAGRAGYMATQAGMNAGLNAGIQFVLDAQKESLRPIDNIWGAAAAGAVLGGGVAGAAWKTNLIQKKLNDAMTVALRDEHVLRQMDQLVEQGDYAAAQTLAGKLSEKQSMGAALNADSWLAERMKIEEEITQRKQFLTSGGANALAKIDPNFIDKGISKAAKWFSASAKILDDPDWAHLNFGEDGVGLNAFGNSTGHAAETIKEMLSNKHLGGWLDSVDAAFAEADKGRGFLGRQKRRDQFMEDVTDTYESGIPHPNPAVNKAAEATGKFFESYKSLLLKTGLLDEGTDGRYVPHIFNMSNVRNLVKAHGTEKIEELIHGSLWSQLRKTGQDAVPEEHLRDLEILRQERDTVTAEFDNVHAEFNALKEKADAADAALAKYAKDNVGYTTNRDNREVNLKKLRKEAEAARKEAGAARKNYAKAKSQAEDIRKQFAAKEKFVRDWPDILKKFTRRLAKGYTANVAHRAEFGHLGSIIHGITLNTADELRSSLHGIVPADEIENIIADLGIHEVKQGSGGRLKMRVDLDMQHRDPNTGVSMTQLFHRNAEYLTHLYARQVSGRVAIAQTTGIKNQSQLAKAIEDAAAASHARGKSTEYTGDMAKNVEYLYKSVVGMPLDADPNGAWVKWSRWLRDASYVTFSPLFAFSQVIEMENTLAHVGVTAMIQQMGNWDTLRAALLRQKPDSGLVQQLRAMAGVGTHLLRNKHFVAVLEDGANLDHNIDRTLFAGKNAIANLTLFNSVMHFEQIMASAGLVQNWVNLARNLKGDISKLSHGDKVEFLSAGIQSDERLKSLFEHLASKDMVKTTNFMGSVHELNTDAWNPDTLNDLMLAITKKARQLVQENSYGTSRAGMHTAAGKFLVQFRNFAFNAVTKQTLQGMSQRDISTGMRFIYGGMLGSLMYMLRTNLTHREVDNYEELMKPSAIAKGAINYMGIFSILPTAWDFATTPFLGQPTFAQARASGTSFAPPAMSMLQTWGQLISGGARSALPGHHFTKREGQALKRAIPILKLPGIANSMDAWIEDLPDYRKEDKYDLLGVIDPMFYNSRFQ